MRFAALAAGVATLVAVIVLFGRNDANDTPAPGPPGATTTAEQPAQTTSDEVRRAVYERSMSECLSTSLTALAGKYHVDAKPGPVSLAVARAWTQQFAGGPDAIESGRDACMFGLRETRR